VNEDQRQAARKVLRTRALLRIDGREQFLVKTMDICSSGVGATCPHQLQPGLSGHIAFEMYYNGKNVHVASRVKVMYCIYNSNDGFKLGLQFLNLDMAGAAAISKYML
jgi:PilZ domain